MVKKALSLILVLIISFSALAVKPFNIHAESVGGDSPIIGVNIHVYDYEMGKYPIQGSISLETEQTQWRCVSSTTGRCDVYQSINSSNTFLDEITGQITYSTTSQYEAFYYEYEFVLDGEYAGYFVLNTGVGATASRTVYVNGGTVKITHPSLITSFTVTSYNLIRVDNPIMWSFPFESLPTIKFCFDQGYEAERLDSLGYYQYPIFKTDTSKVVANGIVQPSKTVVFVVALPSTVTTIDRFNTYFSYNGTITKYDKLLASRGLRVSYIELTNQTDANINSTFTPLQADVDFIPIYYGDLGNNYISTDFALQFGLRNELLDNLSLIAQGTTQTNSSAAEATAGASDLGEASDTLFAQEDTFKSDMNTAMQNVDTTFRLSNFGTSFSKSAKWVRIQFKNLTQNTPFESLITFSLLIGISMILLGKVRK